MFNFVMSKMDHLEKTANHELCRLLRGPGHALCTRSRGLRPGLYAVTRSARSSLLLALVLLTNTSLAQNPGFDSSGFAFAQRAALDSSGFDSSYKLTFRNAVQDKNFYLLSLFQQKPEVRKLLRENKALKRLASDKLQALKMAAQCNDVGCLDRLFRFNGPEINTVANEFEALATHPEFKKLAADMRRSGAFIKYNRQSDLEMLVAAWRDAANGMNRLLSVYCLGHDPTYKDIDRVSFDVSSEAYRKLLKVKTAEIKLSKDPLFGPRSYLFWPSPTGPNPAPK